MKIMTWNVNSIRSRLEHLLQVLKDDQPDVVLLQELKALEEQVPIEEIETLGYNIAIWGQKTFNGVAIFSKYPLEDIQRGIPENDEDSQARYIEAVTNGVRVASVYVPNGEAPGTDKYAYKLKFLDLLTRHAQTLLSYDEKFVMGGDYNVAPQDLDVYDPKSWHEKILCSTPEREHLRRLLYLGFTDALRDLYPDEENLYTWWDYRGVSWPSNKGLRIDHLFLSPQAADVLKNCEVNKGPRGWEKASDHAPVWCELKL
ncbi:Exodeoxyribonuclease III [Candidatus Bealeia paramacronuclearis]|uniref:Exodeoxyribonuclease III n=1 Tax=Candidatus Bealeia paramacronuclearis TaxID=1921001 RepID=A0ABZ2C287_9PROT|nr:Exodeoxyribonuclease III [Candidatus Bealeia paramacronuclearis]